MPFQLFLLTGAKRQENNTKKGNRPKHYFCNQVGHQNRAQNTSCQENAPHNIWHRLFQIIAQLLQYFFVQFGILYGDFRVFATEHLQCDRHLRSIGQQLRLGNQAVTGIPQLLQSRQIIPDFLLCGQCTAKGFCLG